jgi:hypothetical protein
MEKSSFQVCPAETRQSVRTGGFPMCARRANLFIDRIRRIPANNRAGSGSSLPGRQTGSPGT